MAGADLSAKQFCVVTKNGTGRQVVLAGAATDRPLGILQNAPGSGQPANVCTHGTSFAIAGGTFATGAELMTDVGDPGRVITCVPGAGVYSIGVALEAGVDGQRVLVSIGINCVVS